MCLPRLCDFVMTDLNGMGTGFYRIANVCPGSETRAKCIAMHDYLLLFQGGPYDYRG